MVHHRYSETQCPARGYYSKHGRTHLLSPASLGINKPIMVAAHKTRRERESESEGGGLLQPVKHFELW